MKVVKVKRPPTPEHISKQCELLFAARDDLRQAAYFAGYLLKKGWHFRPLERRWSTYMQQSAFTTALVVSYSRPFVKSRQKSRQGHFPEKLLNIYDENQKTLHAKILELRDGIFAHSDVTDRFSKLLAIDGYPTAIERLPEMRLTKDETEQMKVMIANIQVAINNCLSEHMTTLNNSVTTKN